MLFQWRSIVVVTTQNGIWGRIYLSLDWTASAFRKDCRNCLGSARLVFHWCASWFLLLHWLLLWRITLYLVCIKNMLFEFASLDVCWSVCVQGYRGCTPIGLKKGPCTPAMRERRRANMPVEAYFNTYSEDTNFSAYVMEKLLKSESSGRGGGIEMHSRMQREPWENSIQEKFRDDCCFSFNTSDFGGIEVFLKRHFVQIHARNV